MGTEVAHLTSERERGRVSARLRLRVSDLLNAALQRSGMKKAELARALGVDRSAVSQVINGNGNVTINTLADYLSELGYEADIQPVALGEILESMREQRAPIVEELTIRDTHRKNVNGSHGYSLIVQHRLNSSGVMGKWELRGGLAQRSQATQTHTQEPREFRLGILTHA